MASICFVHDNPTQSANDDLAITILTDAGHTVTLRSESLAPLAGFDLVIISESGSSGSVAQYDTYAGAVMVWETSWNSLRLTSAGASSSASTTTLDLQTHAITAGMPDPLTYLIGATSMYGVASSSLPSGVNIVAVNPSATTHCFCIVADTGATLTSGTAPARRAAMGLIDSRIDGLAQGGEDLILAVVDWLVPAGGTEYPVADDDPIGITDSNSVEKISQYARTFTDNIGVSDTHEETYTSSVSVTDSIGVTEDTDVEHIRPKLIFVYNLLTGRTVADVAMLARLRETYDVDDVTDAFDPTNITLSSYRAAIISNNCDATTSSAYDDLELPALSLTAEGWTEFKMAEDNATDDLNTTVNAGLFLIHPINDPFSTTPIRVFTDPSSMWTVAGSNEFASGADVVAINDEFVSTVDSWIRTMVKGALNILSDFTLEKRVCWTLPDAHFLILDTDGLTLFDSTISWLLAPAGVTHDVNPSLTGEDILITDSADIVVSFVHTETNNIGVTDSSTVALTHNRSKTDALGITDTATDGIDYIRGTTDSIGIVDESTIVAVFAETKTDNIGITDSSTLVKGINEAKTDSIGVTDSSTIVSAFARNVTDPVALTDSITDAWDYQEAKTDNIGITDSATVAKEITRDFTNNIGITDSVFKDREHTRQDSVAITDEPSFLWSFDPDDTVTISDEAVLNFSNGAQQTDNIGITEEVIFDLTHVITDDAGLSDAFALIIDWAMTFSDNIGITETSIAKIPIEVQVTDSVGITDELTSLLTEVPKVEIQNIVNLFVDQSIDAETNVQSQPVNASHARAVRVVVTENGATTTVTLQGSPDRTNWFDLADYTAAHTGYEALYELPGPFVRLSAANAHATLAEVVTAGLILETLG